MDHIHFQTAVIYYFLETISVDGIPHRQQKPAENRTGILLLGYFNFKCTNIKWLNHRSINAGNSLMNLLLL